MLVYNGEKESQYTLRSFWLVILHSYVPDRWFSASHGMQVTSISRPMHFLQFMSFTCSEGRGMCMVNIPWTLSSTWSFPEALLPSPGFSAHTGKTPPYTLQISQCRKRHSLFINTNGAVDWVTDEFFYLKVLQCRRRRWWGWWIIRLQHHWSAQRRTHVYPMGCLPIHGALPTLQEKDKAWFSVKHYTKKRICLG